MEMQFKNKSVPIGAVKLGVVVCHTRGERKVYGHVTGFSENCFSEPIIKVQFATGLVTDVHPANVEIY